MKTPLYRLTGRRPGCFDDWADYLENEYQKGLPIEVRVTLSREDSIAEGYLVRNFLGLFHCRLGGRRFSFRKTYGGYLGGDGEGRKAKCLECAIGRLEKDLDRLGEIGIRPVITASLSSGPFFPARQYRSGT